MCSSIPGKTPIPHTAPADYESHCSPSTELGCVVLCSRWPKRESTASAGIDSFRCRWLPMWLPIRRGEARVAIRSASDRHVTMGMDGGMRNGDYVRVWPEDDEPKATVGASSSSEGVCTSDFLNRAGVPDGNLLTRKKRFLACRSEMLMF